MEKRRIITLAGDLASGKGTVSKLLQEDLGYEVYRNGEYFRKLAKEKGMSVTEFNEYVIAYPEIDFQIETSAKEYAKTHDCLIIDARLGWYAVPESFKVYLQVDVEVAAARALQDLNRKETEKFETKEEQKEDLLRRFALENERYFKLYGVRKEEKQHYDLVVDTTYLTPIEVKEVIKQEYLTWLKI